MKEGFWAIISLSEGFESPHLSSVLFMLIIKMDA